MKQNKWYKMAKKDIIEIWKEVYEIQCDFEDLNDEDLIALRKVIKERTEIILTILNKKIKDVDIV